MPSGSDVQQRLAEVKFAWTPSMFLLFSRLGFKQVFTSDTLPCALPNALSSHQHRKPSGYIGSHMSCLQCLLSFSVLPHSFGTLSEAHPSSEVIARAQQLQGTVAHCSPCCRGCFAHIANPNKTPLGLALEVRATSQRRDSPFAKEQSAFVPE